MLTDLIQLIPTFITWNPDPVMFSIGSYGIRWYGLLYATAFITCYYALGELLKKENFSQANLDSVLLYMIAGTIIGARIGDCLFYNGSYYLQHPIEILYIHRGGLSSHGGAIGILISMYIYSRTIKKPFIWVMDRMVVVVGLAGFFIRMGNLMNSEIYGIETSMPWGFIFERRGEVVPKHPTMIYEALYYLMCYILLRWVYRKKNGTPKPYYMFGLFLILVFVFRFLIEFIKNPQESFEQGMLLNMGQILSLPFILLGIGCLIYAYKSKPVPVKINTSKPKKQI